MTPEQARAGLAQARSQLVAAQAVLEVATAMLDGIAAQLEAPEEAPEEEPEVSDGGSCPHPAAERVLATAMGGTLGAEFCNICGQAVPTEAPIPPAEPAQVPLGAPS